MRTSVAAVAISLALGAMAEFGTGPSPFTPPPGSACLGPSDSYRDSNTMVETERRRRSLGITNLPRQWARDLLSNVVEKADQVMGARCVSLQCACVHAGRKTSYGVYTKGQCPVEHGASWEACNIQEDGYTCVFPCSSESLARGLFTDEKCHAAFPGTKALCTNSRPGYP